MFLYFSKPQTIEEINFLKSTEQEETDFTGHGN